MIKIYSLCSGSSGNSTFFKIGNDSFLIDAGASLKFIRKSLEELGEDISNIKAVFITHEHSDHIKGCFMLSKYHKAPIHVLSPSAPFIETAEGFSVTPHSMGYSVELEDSVITSFPVSHDSAACCGYRVTCKWDRSLYFATVTDTGFITEEALRFTKGARAVLVESNHDVDMLRYGPYPPMLKERIRSKRGHLSNDECAEFCAFLSRNGTEEVLLGHLSEENNTPLRAITRVTSSLDRENRKMKVSTAKKSELTPLYLQN